MGKRIDDFLIKAFDVFAASSALAILSPLFCLIALAIKIDSPGPVFFRQRRLGKSGECFTIYKFRTMVEGAQNMGLKMLTAENDSRITRIGKLLRIASIDELPQLINILKGEMSVVGPRPALPYYFEKYDSHQRKRLEVKPGLTGSAQIKGRNTISWPKRIEYDVWYVENRSFLRNLAIIFQTIPVLFKKEFIYGAPKNFEMATSDGGHEDAAYKFEGDWRKPEKKRAGVAEAKEEVTWAK